MQKKDDVETCCLRVLDVPRKTRPTTEIRGPRNRDEERLLILKEIEEKLGSLEEIEDDDRLDLNQLLQDNWEVFSENPGEIKDFKYKFNVKDHKPFL